MQKKKLSMLFFILMSFIMLFGTVACSEHSNFTRPHTHVLTHHDSVESSCIQEGNIEYWSCKICGKYFSTSFGDFEVTKITLPKKAHTLMHYTGIEASCTEDGSIEHWTCCDCGKIFSDELCKNEIDESNITIACGHIYDKFNCCSRCGQKRVYTEGLIYYISLTKGGYFVEGGSNLSGEVIIPPYYNGLPVKGISYMAFSDCKSVRSFVIPSSVTDIRKDAFYGTAFYNDENNWENGVLYIGRFLIEAKSDISGTYQIKNGTSVIADSAFEDCKGLTGITIPDSLVSFGIWAFDGCVNLTQVNYTGELADFCNISGFLNLLNYEMKVQKLSVKVLLNGKGAIGNIVGSDSSDKIRLESVFYEGTKEDWDQIPLASYGDSDLAFIIKSAKRYYFSETQPTDGGNYWRYVNGVPTVW